MFSATFPSSQMQRENIKIYHEWSTTPEKFEAIGIYRETTLVVLRQNNYFHERILWLIQNVFGFIITDAQTVKMFGNVILAESKLLLNQQNKNTPIKNSRLNKRRVVIQKDDETVSNNKIARTTQSQLREIRRNLRPNKVFKGKAEFAFLPE